TGNQPLRNEKGLFSFGQSGWCNRLRSVEPRVHPVHSQCRQRRTLQPDAGAAPHVAILLMHRTANFLSHIGARELSKRGFVVLAMNPRSDNNEAAVKWEDNALDVRSGIEFLRRQAGITKVLLFGHSGGGPAMTFYQAVAEKGPSYCQGPNKLMQCMDNLAKLPKADGMILVDAHPGNSVNGLRSLNPALV